jgi:hypothetical protein
MSSVSQPIYILAVCTLLDFCCEASKELLKKLPNFDSDPAQYLSVNFYLSSHYLYNQRAYRDLER